MQQLGTAGNMGRAFAVELIFQCNGTAVQGCGHGQHLEGGAGLIAIGDHTVAPLLQLGTLQHLPIFLQALKIAFASLRVEQIIQLQFLKGLRLLGIIDFQIGIGVVAAQGCHRQNLTGVDIHHNAKGAVLHVVFINGFLHSFFQHLLHCGIQGQHHIAARNGLDILFIGKGHIHFIIALGGDDLSGGAGKIGVVGRFDPLRAHIGGIGKTKHLRCQSTIGIIALGIGFQVDAGDFLPVDKGTNLGSRRFVHPGGDALIAHFCICRLLGDPIRVYPQYFSQNGRYFANIFLCLF